MPPTFICVDATVDGKKVGGDSGVFMLIDDMDKRTCREVLLAFLHGKGYGDVNNVLPGDSTIILRCVKMNDARLHGGCPAADVAQLALLKTARCFLHTRLPLPSPRCRPRSFRSIVPVLKNPDLHRVTPWFF